MFRVIIIALLIFLGYTHLSKQKTDSNSLSDETAVTSNIDKMKSIGKRVTKNSRAFKTQLNDYIYKFKSISSRKEQTKLHAKFTADLQNHFKNTYSYSFSSKLSAKEEKFFEKLKVHMNERAKEIDRLSYDVRVASAASKTRAYNRECGKKA